MEAIEAHTQRYSRQANRAGSTAPARPIGPPPPLIIIPVVVHIIYGTSAQNLSDAIIKEQIEELNLAFRGALNPGPNGAPLPAAFAARVGDARIQFCLATRDPGGNPTTGITRRNNTGTQYTWLTLNTMKHTSLGGTDAWNTAYYLNIWCGDLAGYLGHGVSPGLAANPNEDGVAMNYVAFGRSSPVLDPTHALGRATIHEIGHWLNLQHIWGDDASGCLGSDNVSDTPNQDGPNSANPTFPHVSCGNGPDGDLFMNHMDYVNDDSKLLFSAGQALRMQAVFAPGGYRESLNSSAGLNPILSIGSLGAMPTTVFCGDQTDYNFRVGSFSVGCGGGSIWYEWTASNGWTVTAPNQLYPHIIPNGTSGSTITLSGTYTNASGTSFVLNPVSVIVGFNPAASTPVFTSGPAHLCAGTVYAARVAPVAGATGYQWTMPADFTPTGQITTSVPTLNLTPNAGIAGGFYSVRCQALGGNCAPSATASVPLTVNGGPQLKIVDADPTQIYQGVVCQRNGIFLELVPVGPTLPGAFNGTYRNIQWSSGGQTTAGTPFPLQAEYYTPDMPNSFFTVTATYIDACNNPKTAVAYSATTAPAGSASLGNGYSCTLYLWRPITPAPTTPYPNPAAGMLQLPGYRGTVVIYNQQGKLVCSLLAPGNDIGATLDTNSWPAGLYVVTGRNLRGEFERHNVQIQH